jgi:serine protease Do
MLGRIRFWGFVGLLGLGCIGAVASIGAQDGIEQTPPQERRSVMVLDGRGSQLGVMVRDLDEAATATLKSGGVRIEEVTAGSPAEKAGIRTGDIVVEYDGERVRSARQFTRLVQETPDGQSVSVVLVRNGERQRVTAVPEARSFSWDVTVDGDRIWREMERSLEGLRGFNFRLEGGRRGLMFQSTRGRLGVTVDTLTDQLAAYFGANDGGVLVTSVSPGTPAEKAGLRAGDVITSINGDRVRSAGELTDELAQAGDGELTIGIVREKKATTLKATVERPSAQTTPRSPRRPVRPAVAARPA